MQRDSKPPEHFQQRSNGDWSIAETHLLLDRHWSLHPKWQEMLAISLAGTPPPLQPVVESPSKAQVHRRRTSPGMAAFYSWKKRVPPVCVDGASTSPRGHHLHPPISFISTQIPHICLAFSRHYFKRLEPKLKFLLKILVHCLHR
jgi:hypothetical protein